METYTAVTVRIPVSRASGTFLEQLDVKKYKTRYKCKYNKNATKEEGNLRLNALNSGTLIN